MELYDDTCSYCCFMDMHALCLHGARCVERSINVVYIH